jgi:FkbM family methyltransferase
MIDQLLVDITLLTHKLHKVPYFSRLWWKAYAAIKQIKHGDVSIRIHGFKVKQPVAFTYPFTTRLVEHYNNPLVECVYQTFTKKNAPLTIIDAGAAIGDTVLLLKSNCPGMVEKFYCIDGDNEFFHYLRDNMKPFPEVECIKAMLSDNDESVSELIRIHGGTASAQGSAQVSASSIDSILREKNIRHVDLLKIDVDGYDGKVLSGATNLLIDFQPTVIFEWHPKLLKGTGNDALAPFRKLTDAGYNRFIWFTKYGDFSHFTMGVDEKYLNQFAAICLKSSWDSDLHYDIVALPESSSLAIEDFANSDYSRKRLSRY